MEFLSWENFHDLVPHDLHDLLQRLENWLPVSLTGRAVLVGAGVGILVYYVTRVTRKRYRLPPGPRGWPLIGNILDFRKAKVYEKLEEWQKVYGPVITIHAGPLKMIALCNIDVVTEALVKRGADFAGRPQSYSINLISDGGRSIAFGDYSPTWKLHRKLVAKAFRYYLAGSLLEEGIERSLRTGVELMKKEKGEFNPLSIVSLVVFNIINNMCFSDIQDIDDPHFKELLYILDTFNGEFGNGFLEDFIPLLRYFPTKKFRKLERFIGIFFGYMETYRDNHKKTLDRDNLRDLTDAILVAQEEAETDEDPEVMSQITDRHVTQTLSDIFGAGMDTSRFTLTWSLLYLSAYPEVQEKMHQEIDKAFGTRSYPKVSDRSNLPYTEAVLHEVMRMSTVVPLGLPHCARCDTSVGGYDIPKGTMVLINHYALHRDPEQWVDPEEFRPERFLDSDGKMAPKPISWLPFSAGRRVCLGEVVAKPELHLLLAGIVRHFKVSPPDGEKPTFESIDGSFVIIPKDFKITVESRL